MGIFKNGLLNGKGRTVFGSYTTEGEFENDFLHGEGKMQSSLGYSEAGLFQKDQLIKGEIIETNGDKYEGDFKYKKLNGNGKITYHTGEVFQGEFKDNQLNGNGERIFPNRKIYKGTFKNNQLNGPGKIMDRTRCTQGNFVNDISQGPVKIIYPEEGLLLEGNFENGIAKGSFKITFRNGCIHKSHAVEQYSNGQLKIRWRETHTSAVLSEGKSVSN